MMKRKREEVEIECLSDDDVVDEGCVIIAGEKMAKGVPTQEDDMTVLYSSVKSTLGLGSVNKLWMDKQFQRALNDLIKNEKKRYAMKNKIVSHSDAIRIADPIVRTNFHTNADELCRCGWTTIPEDCKHLLVLDLENVRFFFDQAAEYEVEKQLELIPENCYVFAAWGTAGYSYIQNFLKGHVLERLVKSGKICCKFSGGTHGAADSLILSTLVDVIMDEHSAKFPITLVSSDKDFNELHVMATDHGFSYNRMLSFDDRHIKEDELRGPGWKEMFFTQLRSRLNTKNGRKTLPVIQNQRTIVTDGNYTLNFLTQSSIFQQLYAQNYFQNTGRNLTMNNNNGGHNNGERKKGGGGWRKKPN
eukprot:TRINITY_DN2707_c0_g2_i1.p1 TRINITY_DN2707_c0_g2~~TRINITY_DN2707_c0_g2_i1.p1  ORF type:complete len:378 (+),score=69.54 TRINITY_DN2707_c0_g2_i1:56-1135(+)